MRLDYPSEDDEIVYPSSWESYKNYSSIVLLGAPRKGKTTEFEFQCNQCVNGFLLELRNVDFDDKELSLCWSDTEQTRWDIFLNGNESGELFIDSLDEGRNDTPQAAKKVVKWLRTIMSASVRTRLRVHISCRELEWERTDQSLWDNLFPPIDSESDGKTETVPSYIKLALLPLSYAETVSCLADAEVDARAFFRSLPKASYNLIHWPQTLRMLIELYASQGCFANIENIYQQTINKRIQESNDLRAVGAQVSLAKRLNIAQELAALLILSGREVISLRNVDTTIELDAGLASENMADIREVVGSELFERFSIGKVRFEDHTLAAFLAAQWIIKAQSEQGLPNDSLLPLLYAEANAEEVIPALRMLAGWLAILSSEVRAKILSRSPGLLLSNDFPDNPSDEGKIALWKWMKQEFGGRDWFDYRKYSDNAIKLVCPEVVNDVALVLDEHEGYGLGLRLFALEILTAGHVKKYDGLLISLVLRESEALMMRRYALQALADTSPERLSEIKSLLTLSIDDDPDLDLLGSALFHLYPDNLSTEEILEHFERTKNSHSHGMFQAFVRKVAIDSTADERAIILSYLEKKLSHYLEMRQSHQGNVPDWMDTFDPGLEFDDFLLEQLRAWGDSSEHYPNLERWLHLLANANTYGLLSSTSAKNISEVLNTNHSLRRAIGIIRIERFFEEKGAEFKPYDIHLHDRLYYSQAQDLEFWKQVLVLWANHASNKLGAAWNEFIICLKNSEYPIEVLDWLDAKAALFSSIIELWEAERIHSISDEYLQDKQSRLNRVRKKNQRKREWFTTLRQAISEIQQGHQGWLENIVSNIRFEEKEVNCIVSWLYEQVGKDVAEAYTHGLATHWQNASPPPIESYVSPNNPWSNVITEAVNHWLGRCGDWGSLAPTQRQNAIRAAMWSSDIPHWFFDAVTADQTWAKQFFLEVLDVEDTSDHHIRRVPFLLSGCGKESFVRSLIVDFLANREKVRTPILEQMLRLLCENAEEYPLGDSILDLLWSLAVKAIETNEQDHFLLLSATVFRFRQMDVWLEVDHVYLSLGNRTEHFCCWLNAIEKIHLRFHFEGKWPSWIDEKSVVAMLPDMFEAFPPHSDPDIVGRNNGQIYRMGMGNLRNHGFSVLAESGSEFAGNQLHALLSAPYIPPTKHSWIWNNIDIWRERRAKRAWVPLIPEDIKKVLFEDALPVQTAEDLYILVCNIIEEIRLDIEKGEENIRTLFWNEGRPKVETEFQKMIARDFRRSVEATKNKIVSGRELDVKGNRPDIFTTCILPNGERARVFLEMKRQQFYEKKKGADASHVLNAIKTQLIGKYLTDAETSYGLYLVGWYGQDYYGSYITALRQQNEGILPTTADEFEKLLQRIADHEAANSDYVSAIRVVVIDLSLQASETTSPHELFDDEAETSTI